MVKNKVYLQNQELIETDESTCPMAEILRFKLGQFKSSFKDDLLGVLAIRGKDFAMFQPVIYNIGDVLRNTIIEGDDLIYILFLDSKLNYFKWYNN